MPTLFTRIKNANGKIVAYPTHEQWLDIGRPEDLFKANNGNFLKSQERKGE